MTHTGPRNRVTWARDQVFDADGYFFRPGIDSRGRYHLLVANAPAGLEDHTRSLAQTLGKEAQIQGHWHFFERAPGNSTVCFNLTAYTEDLLKREGSVSRYKRLTSPRLRKLHLFPPEQLYHQHLSFYSPQMESVILNALKRADWFAPARWGQNEQRSRGYVAIRDQNLRTHLTLSPNLVLYMGQPFRVVTEYLWEASEALDHQFLHITHLLERLEVLMHSAAATLQDGDLLEEMVVALDFLRTVRQGINQGADFLRYKARQFEDAGRSSLGV